VAVAAVLPRPARAPRPAFAAGLTTAAGDADGQRTVHGLVYRDIEPLGGVAAGAARLAGNAGVAVLAGSPRLAAVVVVPPEGSPVVRGAGPARQLGLGRRLVRDGVRRALRRVDAHDRNWHWITPCKRRWSGVDSFRSKTRCSRPLAVGRNPLRHGPAGSGG